MRLSSDDSPVAGLCSRLNRRATFGCWLLARLERLAKGGAAINPLLIVKILMAHEDIESTDRYLRAVAIDTHVLADVLDRLLAEKHGR